MSASQDTEGEPNLGVLSRGGGYVEARLSRRFDHPPARVWAALTEPGKFVEWLAPGEIASEAGGRARLDFVDSGTVIDSTVTAYEAPRLLEYAWSGPGEPLRPVRWEVEADGDGSRLTLTLRTPDGEDAARSCAGWEAHLEMLAAALEGVPIKFPFERFKSTREAYKGLVAALG